MSFNTRFRAHEVEDILGRAGCRALVLWPGFKGIALRGILAAARPETLAGVQQLIVYGEAADEPAFDWPGLTPVAYATLRDGAEDTAAPAPADSRCVIFTTSGSSRAPKFVCHAQPGVAQHARDLAAAFGLDARSPRVAGAAAVRCPAPGQVTRRRIAPNRAAALPVDWATYRAPTKHAA